MTTPTLASVVALASVAVDGESLPFQEAGVEEEGEEEGYGVREVLDVLAMSEEEEEDSEQGGSEYTEGGDGGSEARGRVNSFASDRVAELISESVNTAVKEAFPRDNGVDGSVNVHGDSLRGVRDAPFISNNCSTSAYHWGSQK